jgi:hypothetical protein
VRSVGTRNKKLIVAFHFQFANQAAWKCDACRSQGLEKQRRCGWLPASMDSLSRPVWARRKTAMMECPRSYITAASLSLVEEFFAWKAGGGGNLMNRPARTAEAFFILEREWKAEIEHAE